MVIPVEKLKHFPGFYASAGFVKNIKEFKGRRFDILISVQMKNLQDPVLDRCLPGAFHSVNVPDAIRRM